MRATRWLIVIACASCTPAPRGPDRRLAEEQYALAAAAKAQHDLPRAVAATETAWVFETTPHAREVLGARVTAFTSEPAPSSQARVTALYQAQLLLKDEKDPATRAGLLAASAWVHLLAGDPATAGTELDAALRESPEHRGALLLLARHLETQRRYREAATIDERLLKLDSSNKEVLQSYGRLLLLLGDTDKAVAFLTGARVLDDSHVIALQLAEALERAGRIPEAVGVLEKALSHDAPDSAHRVFLGAEALTQLRRKLGWLLLDLGRDADAERVLRQAQTDLPSVEGALALAQLDLQRGQVGRAVDAVNQSWAQLPATTRCLWVAAMALFQAGRADEARRLAEQYLAVAVHDPREGPRLTALLTWLQKPPVAVDAGTPPPKRQR